ncbi:PREDICTED: probable cytochrome P450 6a14 [Polistes dominula]|uniref:Probable cytochrome P450 6a14 n=1 Tax=Polistes dominula TaxID=743375 RepID=A0ABM1IM58_POLDO|nr:PREDICTED: probable cytochrome P450 6a14 [Polistes dominula]
MTIMMNGWIISEFIGALFVIIAGIYLYFKLICFNFWKKRNVPYEEPIFPVGNLLELILDKQTIGDVFGEIYMKNKSHPFVGAYSFFKPNLVINDPNLIRFVLTKEFATFHDRGLYCNEKVDPLTGHLFFLPGQKWRNLRVRLTPTFTSGKIKNMFDTIQENGDLLENFLEKKAHDKNEIDVKEIFSCLFTDIIMSIAFGISCNSLENPKSEFRYYGKKMFEPRPIINTLMVFGSQILDLFSIPFIDKKVSRFFLSAFEDTVNYREAHNIVRKDFLDLIMQLMKNGYVKSDEEKRVDSDNDTPKEVKKLTMPEGAAQAFVYFLAGFETTSSTVTFCLYELAMNPEIQKKTQEEIDRVLEKHGGISYNAISEMTYLHMVVSETLRKYPPLPFLNRIALKDIELPDSNVVVPKGTPVIIPLLGLHNDPEFYPEPEKFIPERFTEENIRTRHQYTYLPFGEGPRICIGMRFALVQTKVVLTNALQKFTYSPGPKTPKKIKFLPGSLTLNTEGGLYLQIQPRL